MNIILKFFWLVVLDQFYHHWNLSIYVGFCVGLESTHHVLVKKADQVYSVVLGMVDVIRGTNSYYKLQILESDKGKNYRVFRSWGRVGTTIGGNKLEVGSCLYFRFHCLLLLLEFLFKS